MQTIFLKGYQAIADRLYLRFGTADSYGIEKVKIIPGEDWAGMTITATFVTTESSTKVVVPDDGIVNVPQEATKVALTVNNFGKIVFTGVADGVQRISTDVFFVVTAHSPVDGKEPEMTPSEWEQYVTEIKKVLNTAIPPDGLPGQVLTKTDDGNVWTFPSGGGGSGGGGYTIGAGLKLDPESNILSVDTAKTVEQDNTLPVTSAAVYTTVGNIEVLLGTI